jgi:predicted nucleotidyltransferase
MVNIEELKPKIVEALKPLKPNKIILFGSYAYGTPNEDSDIDLMMVQSTLNEHSDAMAMVKLRGLMKDYKIGFDVLSATEDYIAKRKEPFYQEDILKKGITIYG